jgi:cell division protein FtsZ
MCDNDSVPCIKVLGVGSAGGNVINRLYEMGVENAELIAIDLYKQHLDVIRADKKVLMKRPPVHGLICSGFHPWLGEQAASLSIETIEGLFQGSTLFSSSSAWEEIRARERHRSLPGLQGSRVPS